MLPSKNKNYSKLSNYRPIFAKKAKSHPPFKDLLFSKILPNILILLVYYTKV